MSRLDRLELVVARLAKRILGEDVTFDQIAEKEAAEQGVVFVPPPPQAPAPDLDPLVSRIEALESRPTPVPHEFHEIPPAFDPAPLLAEIEALKQHMAAADRRHVEQEQVIQALLQEAENHRAALSKSKSLIEFVLSEGMAAPEKRKAG